MIALSLYGRNPRLHVLLTTTGRSYLFLAGAGENFLQPLGQRFAVGGEHPNVPVQLVESVFPADVGTAKHDSGKASSRKDVFEPPVPFMNVEVAGVGEAVKVIQSGTTFAITSFLVGLAFLRKG